MTITDRKGGDIKQRFDEIGLEPVGSQPDAFAKFVAQDVAMMRDLARKIGLAVKELGTFPCDGLPRRAPLFQPEMTHEDERHQQ